ncbi:Rpn family recombination-promoting nuclease/putative transposase [Spirosoma montaniterrae]|uniref:Transposase (putative) YhgA-like domain-containing protein n=1 Tax=Spirosoma montaniterrae TaxID=1178516 RepID=A0A1P9WUJ2_9BACT|nr:Rpn family recombination-promoting nuclease/putative transposase [Spirosoma montaniterrae]AQG79047.1 hypothetical protein AWR27_06750 [Spirosoma montaniterrae]
MAENIHDKFFKENFSRHDIALAFVEEVFPASLLKKLKLETFALSNASYVDTTLEEYFADIVYSCRYDDEQSLEIAILFEHKSYKETYPHFQLLRYLLNSWEQARKQNQLPTLLIPIIIYHGKARWNYEPLRSYFGVVDDNLSRFVPDFEYLLFDISRHTDDEILGFRNRFLATSLFLMKHRENEQRLLAQRDRLFVWLEDISDLQTGSNYLQATLVYLFRNLDFRTKEFYQQLFSTPRNSQKAMSTYDYLIEEGRKEGRLEVVVAFLKMAYQQGIDITKFLNQDYGLPKEQVQVVVDKIKKGQL